MVASPPPPPPNYGNDLRVAAENVKAIQDLFGAGKSALLGSAATDKSAETSGFAGAGGKWDPSKGWLGGLGAAHGGAIRGYATDGRVNDDDASPYGVPSFVPNEKPNIPALKTAPAAPGHSGGLGSDIMDVAKFGSSIAGLASLFGLSDKRLKENIHQIGKTFDGQPVYRYNYKGHPETQIGLIAQEVERKHPEAVGVAGNYKTVDYGRATEDAAHRGHFGYGGAPMGGLVSRHGFQAGGQPDESNDNSNQGSLTPELRRIIDKNIAEQPVNRAWSANRAVESSGSQFSPSGNPLTSKKGATGISQIMPSTGPEAAKLAGVEWDPERFASDANYNNQLGLAYFKNLHGTVGGGDAGLTAAAYNAGPGAVANAIGLARTRGGNPTDYLPQETFEHTNKVLTNLGMPNVPPGIARSIAAGSPESNMRAESTIDPETLGARRAVAELTANFAQRQKELLGEKREPSWFENNQAWLTPLLTGVATMASSPSRYLGSALLQGLGGAASSFGNVQNQISTRRLQEQQAMQAAGAGIQSVSSGVSSLANAGMTNSQIQQYLANAGATSLDAAGRATMVDPNVARTRAETGLIGAQTGVAKAEEENTKSRTEQTTALTRPMVDKMREETAQLVIQGKLTAAQAAEVLTDVTSKNAKLIQEAIFQPAGGPVMVKLNTGNAIPFSEWIARGKPPLLGESAIAIPDINAPLVQTNTTPSEVPLPAPAPGSPDPGTSSPGGTINRTPTNAKTPEDYTYKVGFGNNGQNVLKKEIEEMNIGGVNQSVEQEKNNKRTEEINQVAQNAFKSRNQTLELAQNLIRSGFLAPGKTFQGREQIMSLAQAFSDVLGLGQIDPRLSSAQIAEKLVTQSVGQQTQNMGQHAQMALQTMKSGFASNTMTPEAIQSIIADLLISSQQDIDLQAYNNIYRHKGQSMGYPAVGKEVANAFRNDYNLDFWRNEKEALVKMMQFPQVDKQTSNPTNPFYKVTPIQHIMGSPESKAMIPSNKTFGDTYRQIYNPGFVEKQYGPGIYRYFSGAVM